VHDCNVVTNRAALEVYRLNKDEADLADTLVRIARRTIEDISGTRLEGTTATSTTGITAAAANGTATAATAGTDNAVDFDDTEVEEGVDLVSEDRYIHILYDKYTLYSICLL
jgi:hypothetical protein